MNNIDTICYPHHCRSNELQHEQNGAEISERVSDLCLLHLFDSLLLVHEATGSTYECCCVIGAHASLCSAAAVPLQQQIMASSSSDESKSGAHKPTLYNYWRSR